MNNEFVSWLDRATAGLPSEIQGSIRGELTSHYVDAVENYEHIGETPDAAHQRAMDEIGDANATARALRKTHLSSYRPLVAFVGMGFVFCWLVLNRGNLSPYVWSSGSTRIVAGAVIALIFQGTLWLLRDLLTRQLQLSFLKLPLDMQRMGWGLMIFPFMITVLLAKITPVRDFLSNNLPQVDWALFQLCKVINVIAYGFIGVGLLLMVWRLSNKKAIAYLYDSVHLLRWISILGGLTVIYTMLIQILNIARVNFAVAGTDDIAQISLIVGDYAPDRMILLTDGINWFHRMSQFSRLCQVALLGVMVLFCFRAYWHNNYWLKQTA